MLSRAGQQSLVHRPDILRLRGCQFLLQVHDAYLLEGGRHLQSILIGLQSFCQQLIMNLLQCLILEYSRLIFRGGASRIFL